MANTRSHRFVAPIAGALLPILISTAGCGATYDFQEVTVGGTADPGRAPRPREDGQFVRALYADVLDRGPQVFDLSIDPGTGTPFSFPIDEAETLGAFFGGVGDPAPLRALLTAGLVRSAESRLPRREDVKQPGDFIAGQFRRLLGRDPSAYELHAFLAEWQRDPVVGPQVVVRAIIASRAYQGLQGGTQP